MTFKFVPEYQQAMITASLVHLPGWELVSAEYVGSRSATRAVYQRNGNEVEVWLPYDFAVLKPEAERGRAVAELVNPPRTAKIAIELAGETADLMNKILGKEPASDTPDKPEKPAKGNRRKKAVSDSKDGDE